MGTHVLFTSVYAFVFLHGGRSYIKRVFVTIYTYNNGMETLSLF